MLQLPKIVDLQIDLKTISLVFDMKRDVTLTLPKMSKAHRPAEGT